MTCPHCHQPHATRQTHDTCRTVTLTVLDDPTVCPDCGAPLDALVVVQPALVRHAGYGGGQQRTSLHCPRCTWSLTTHIATLPPARHDRCDHCGLPIVADSHTHHTDGCGIDQDGCTCPPRHGYCCPTCKETSR